LSIVFLTEDLTARAILLTLNSRPLARSEFTAGAPRIGLVNSDPGLLGLKTTRFAPRQLTVANSLPDSRPLILLPIIDPLRQSHQW
jgi:hypothetical protein